MDSIRLRKVVNICLVIMFAGSWIVMTLFGEGTLSQNGLGNLKYFTVLSNFLEAAASAVWLADSHRNGKAGGRSEKFKYVAAASVGLTFTTVMVFLGPLYGYSAMFTGANLFFHMIIPVAAMAEIVLLSEHQYTVSDNNLAVIPPLIYGAVYLINIALNGIGEWPDTNDWYLFLAWGYPVGILIFAVICLVTWSIGFFMRKVKLKG